MVEEHETLLRGASFLGSARGPAILQRTDEDPIGVLLENLAGEAGRGELAGSLAGDRNEDGVLELFQPVHRTWHLALLEIACDAPGRPRLDPRRIESAGLVVRRIGPDGALEGWRRAGRKLRGWLSFGQGEERLDPDPKKRRPARSSGHPEIDRRLMLLGGGEPLEESVSPLFTAPPEVCKAAGRTLLYGLVPVTSAERSEVPATLAGSKEKAFTAAALTQIPFLLQSASENVYSWNRNSCVLTPDSKAGVNDLTKDLDHLSKTLAHLHIQLDAFDGGEAGRRVLALLDEIPLRFGGTFRPAGKVLAEAAEVLLFRSPGAGEVRMPDAWPAIPESLRARLAEAVVAAMRERLKALTAGEGRFDAPGGRYVLEAFARVKSHHPHCPAKLVWTEQPSQPFRIVPWYEAGALPPVQVVLPDVTDRGALRKLKPNVAFVLPKGLKDVIEGSDLEGLLKGNKGGPGLGLGWICGFSIPIITLCAFFVLNIFLKLLDFVFFWMAFIKICIPFPKSDG
jgi:hypothetical protein